MSTLRLPLIGDFVYVSRVGEPDVERKYVVSAEVDDGYHIVPEGLDSADNTSMIKYKFLTKKWVVHGAEDTFNVRIQLNPELYDTELELDITIQDLIEQGNFDEAKRLADRLRSISDLNAVLVNSDRDEGINYPLYRRFMESPNRTNIFDWLERNYFVDYLKYLVQATQYSTRENPDALEPLEWLSARVINWTKYDLDVAVDMVIDHVVGEDIDDTFKILMMIPGLIDALERALMRMPGVIDTDDLYTAHKKTFMEVSEDLGATNILELLRTVPSKAVQVKHL